MVVPDAAKHLSPLGYNSVANDSDNSTVFSSRYDLAQTSIDQFRRDVIARIAADSTNWWRPLVYNGSLSGSPPYRFQGSTFFTHPLDSAQVAYTTPTVLTRCSQFIVEYAGDFLSQDPTRPM